MEKTYKRVPFDIELAKKIQLGEVEGRIVTDLGHTVRIVCFDARNTYPIIALINLENSNCECMRDYSINGINYKTASSLSIELAEKAPKHEFKVGDKVIVNMPISQVDMLNNIYDGKQCVIKDINKWGLVTISVPQLV